MFFITMKYEAINITVIIVFLTLTSLANLVFSTPHIQVQMIDLVVKSYKTFFDVECSVLSIEARNKGKCYLNWLMIELYWTTHELFCR